MIFSERNNSPDYNPDTTKIAILFMSVQFLGFFYFNGFRVVFPFILKEVMNYTEAQVVVDWGTIFGIGFFIGSLTRYPMGLVADKLSRNQTITLSILILSLSTIGIYFTRDILILALLFATIRTGTHLPPLITRGYVNETNPLKQGKINGYVYVWANLGGFLGPILFTFFLNLSFFYLILLSNLILFIFYIYYFLKIPTKKSKNVIPLKKFIRNSLVELFSNFKRVIVLFVIIGLINGIINYLQVPYALYVVQLSNSDTSIIIGFILLCTTVFILFTGSLTDHLGVSQTIYLGLLIVIIGSLIQILNKTDVVFFLFSEILISGGILLCTNSLVTNVTLRSQKETTASIFGGTSSFYFFGSSLIPGIASSLYLQDPLLPFWLIIIISLMIFPFGFYINKKTTYNKKMVLRQI